MTSSFFTKVLLINYLQYKFHDTGAISTMETISIIPPKCGTWDMGHVLCVKSVVKSLVNVEIFLSILRSIKA